MLEQERGEKLKKRNWREKLEQKAGARQKRKKLEKSWSKELEQGA